MPTLAVSCSVQIGEREDTEPGGLIFRLRPDSECAAQTHSVAERLARAAEWVMDLDAQYRDLIHAGRSPQVNVPAIPTPRVGRVQRETSADYRKLQLGVGELIRPLLLDPPELEELYPFQRQGAEWLMDQRGAILADDMGLGKTVQVIAAMRLLFNRAMLRSALIACPKGLARLRQLGPLGDGNALIFRDRTPKGRHYTARPGGPQRGFKTAASARVASAISGAVDAGVVRGLGSAGYGVPASDGARRRSAHGGPPSGGWRTSRGWRVG